MQQACDSCEAAPGAADTEQRPEAVRRPQNSLVKHPLPDTDDAVDWDAVRRADIEEVRAAGICYQHAYCLCHSKMTEAVKSTLTANCSCRNRLGRSVCHFPYGAEIGMQTCRLWLTSEGSFRLLASEH